MLENIRLAHVAAELVAGDDAGVQRVVHAVMSECLGCKAENGSGEESAEAEEFHLRGLIECGV